jgi:penicillin-binding protein 1A
VKFESAQTNSPYLQGAFVAIDPAQWTRARHGQRPAVRRLKFNRAAGICASRRSTFKPVMYAAAIPLRHRLRRSSDSYISLEQQSGEDVDAAGLRQQIRWARCRCSALCSYRRHHTRSTRYAGQHRPGHSMARKFGITPRYRRIRPYSNALIDVYPLEMIGAYSVFTNLGLRTTPHATIVKVRT